MDKIQDAVARKLDARVVQKRAAEVPVAMETDSRSYRGKRMGGFSLG